MPWCLVMKFKTLDNLQICTLTHPLINLGLIPGQFAA